jgi:hypothetical protein
VSADRTPDPQAEAERKLRIALAAEARAERAMLGRIKMGFYGGLTLVVALVVFLLFFL